MYLYIYNIYIICIIIDICIYILYGICIYIYRHLWKEMTEETAWVGETEKEKKIGRRKTIAITHWNKDL